MRYSYIKSQLRNGIVEIVFVEQVSLNASTFDIPVLRAVRPAMLERFTTDDPPLSLAPSIAAADFSMGCNS